MSAHTRKHHTNEVAHFKWHGTHYSVPLNIIEKYKDPSNEKIEETVSPEEVFSDLIKKRGKPGATLRGVRGREGMTQIAFAKAIAVTQANLSAMENGRRAIGKEIAKRVAKKFGFDYRILL